VLTINIPEGGHLKYEKADSDLDVTYGTTNNAAPLKSTPHKDTDIPGKKREYSSPLSGTTAAGRIVIRAPRKLHHGKGRSTTARKRGQGELFYRYGADRKNLNSEAQMGRTLRKTRSLGRTKISTEQKLTLVRKKR